MTPSAGRRGSRRREVWVWCFYDFGNSAFTTLVVTFIYSAFFTQVIAADEVRGTALWSRGVTISSLVVALLSPVLGALADRHGWRKPLLALCTAVCVVGSVGLYYPVAGQAGLALALFIVANIGFELGGVFYNAFLPDIAPTQRIGRVSGYGWALGYVGGLSCMGLGLVGLVDTETPWFGFTTQEHANIRATNLLVAVWFALFSLPALIWLREPAAQTGRAMPSVGELWRTLARVLRYRQVTRLLLARLLYNDGLVTVFAFAGIFAVGTFGFTMADLMFYGVATSAAGGVGALLGGFLDDRLGARLTVMGSLVGMVIGALIAVLTEDVQLYWAASLLIASLAGPTQAASRSLMGRFVPADAEAEFFGFFAFSGKATAFAGPLLLGILTEVFRSQRAGIAVVVVFLVSGGLLLATVNEDEGMREGGR